MRSKSRQPSRIALLGLFGVGNIGNDGSLQAMIEFIAKAQPDANVRCISPGSTAVERKFGIKSLPSRITDEGSRFRLLNRLLFKVPSKIIDMAASIALMWTTDLLVMPGTGVLDDFGEQPLGVPYDVFKWCLMARLLGARVAFVSVGAGPIRHPVSRWFMINGAKLAHFRSYRDEISKIFMTEAGVRTADDPILPDLAFRLKSPRVAPPRGHDKLVVGLGVMTYRGWTNAGRAGEEKFKTYIEKLSGFAKGILAEGHSIRLLTGEEGDNTAVALLRRRLDGDAPDRIAVADCSSLATLMEEAGRTDLVVATRFHNVLCALKMAVPTISIGYAKKNDVLMEERGLGDYCQHIETLDVALLDEQFHRLVAERDEIRERLEQANDEMARRIATQDRVLVSALFERQLGSPAGQAPSVGSRLAAPEDAA